MLAKARLVATVRVSYVELRAALAAARRGRRLTAPRVQRAVDQLDLMWRNVSILEVDEALVTMAAVLAESHQLRAYDAVQLAGLVRLGNPGEVDTFACWDARLREVALGFGYSCIPSG